MKRIKKISIFLFFVLLLIPFTAVKAADATCADVTGAVSELEDINSMYNQLDCDNTTDTKSKYECNTLKVRRAAVLEDLYKYNDDKVCPSVDLTATLANYDGECTNEFSSQIKKVSETVMNFFYISAPFILIIFGSLDFFKVVVSNDPEQMKKSRTNFFKRLAAFILLYITPFFVKFLFSLTPYELYGTNYVCAHEIDLSSDRSNGGISGVYGGNNYGIGGSSADGQRIAEAAKEIKQDGLNNNYTWGCNYGPSELQGTKSYKKMCCTELLGAALYRSGIYDAAGANEHQEQTAAYLATNLRDKGWILITNENDLQPGDVLFYEKLVNPGSATAAVINGKSIHICHTDIYYGDGKKVSTGSFNGNVFSNFKVDTSCYSVSSKWRFAYRFPGKK